MGNRADLFTLVGKTAIVTGAASGIGREIALGLADAGAFVVAADLQNDATRELAAEMGGGRCMPTMVDVSSSAAVSAMVANVLSRREGIDVLVNSAGIGGRARAEDYPEELWDRVIAVNLKGTFLCCQAVGRVMLAAGSGSIVNLASIAGLVGIPGSGPGYQASKGGVVQLTRALAVQWASRGVRVNAIAPAHVETELTRRLWADEPELRSSFLSRTPLGDLGQAADLVGPALFLACPASRLVTGQILAVDGGYTAQ
jgi:NAD(P)-dependent dehydrogenase (short-subunit alcohol dehydrogenase family)